MNTIKVNVGFHGKVDFGHPASVSGIIANTSKILASNGFSFRIFCDSSKRKHLEHKIPQNIVSYTYSNRFSTRNTKIYIWHKILWISYKLANSYVDIIHIHQKPEIVIAHSLFKTTNQPVIFHISNHPDAWKGLRWRRAFQRSDLVISISKFTEKRLIEKFPFLKGKTKVLYSGVDTEIFSPLGKKRGLKQKGNEFTVFFAGNIWKEKGFDIILKTAQILQKENIKFLIAGTFSPETNSLHREFKNNSPENVKYLGCIRHDDLAGYYVNADLTIVPSRWEEPFGMVIIESMSCGTSVIASRIGGIPELIDDGINGLFVTSGSVNELRNGILWCKNHPRKLKEMGVEARKKALKFGWKIISDQLGEIYEEILS